MNRCYPSFSPCLQVTGLQQVKNKHVILWLHPKVVLQNLYPILNWLTLGHKWLVLGKILVWWGNVFESSKPYPSLNFSGLAITLADTHVSFINHQFLFGSCEIFGLNHILNKFLILILHIMRRIVLSSITCTHKNTHGKKCATDSLNKSIKY